MKHTLFLHDKPLVGIEVGSTYLKLMSINTKKWLVTSYASITADPQKMQDCFTNNTPYLSELMSQLLEKNIVGRIPSNHAVVSIPTSRTYSRVITVPLAASKEMREAINLEAELYIPVPLSDLNISYEIIRKDKESIEALMSAAPKKVVDVVQKACEAAELNVLSVEPSISSIARLIMATEEGQLPTVIVDIGAATTDVAILDKKIRATGGVQVGGNTFTVDISKKLSTSLENAHQIKILHGLNVSKDQAKIRSAVKPSIDQIVNEVRKLIRYYNERIDSKSKLEQIVIVGGGANIPGIGDYFTNELVMAARVASPWQKLDFGKLAQPAKQFRARYLTVAGAASLPQKDIWR